MALHGIQWYLMALEVFVCLCMVLDDIGWYLMIFDGIAGTG